MGIEASYEQDLFCPVLQYEIALQTASDKVGTVSTEPLTKVLSWQGLSNPDLTGKDPVYLEPNYSDGSFCLYPINFRDPNAKPFAPENLFRSETKQIPNLFGKPTQLTFSPGTAPESAIYDPEQGYFYAADSSQRGWYLIGDSLRFYLFLEGIEEFAARLTEKWNANPRNFIPQETKNKKGAAGKATGKDSKKSRYTTREAGKEIRLFLKWLQTQDPKLTTDIKGLLHYTPSTTLDGVGKVYAYFTSQEDRIYLTPISIQQLWNRDYPSVAETLVHEWTHRENYRLGLVSASDDMMWKTLQVFASRLDEKDLLFNIYHQWAYPKLLENLFHNQLPIIDEDEISARAQELLYSVKQETKPASFPTETLGWLDFLAKDLSGYFPYGWASLASEYFYLTNPSLDAIPQYLMEDLQERARCVSEKTSCVNSTAWQSLQQYVQSSHLSTGPGQFQIF